MAMQGRVMRRLVVVVVVQEGTVVMEVWTRYLQHEGRLGRFNWSPWPRLRRSARPQLLQHLCAVLEWHH